MRLRNMATLYIFDGDKLLLIHRVGSRAFTGAIWVGVGGHMEDSEINDPLSCALREMREETGLTPGDITPPTLKYITTRKADDEIRQQYIFIAELQNKNAAIVPCDEGEIFWIPEAELFSRNMAFTNSECLKHYFANGKNSEIFLCAAGARNGEPFVTITALGEYSKTH